MTLPGQARARWRATRFAFGLAAWAVATCALAASKPSAWIFDGRPSFPGLRMIPKSIKLTIQHTVWRMFQMLTHSVSSIYSNSCYEPQGIEMNRRQASAEARRALDRSLAPFRKTPQRPPPKGWIRAIRDALGMTAEQLGERMGVSQPSVQRLELSEAEGTIQLSSLKRAAAALDCEVIYALVPRRTLKEIYEREAAKVARRELGLIGHTMALEDQAVDDDEEDRLRRFIVEELNPRELWRR